MAGPTTSKRPKARTRQYFTGSKTTERPMQSFTGSKTTGTPRQYFTGSKTSHIQMRPVQPPKLSK